MPAVITAKRRTAPLVSLTLPMGGLEPGGSKNEPATRAGPAWWLVNRDWRWVGSVSLGTERFAALGAPLSSRSTNDADLIFCRLNPPHWWTDQAIFWQQQPLA